MSLNRNASVQVLASPNENERVEVSLERENEENYVALKYAVWTEGLGWCGQKTIRLSGDQLDDLHHALTVARHRINRQRCEEGTEYTPAKVIQMPALN